MRDNSSAAVDDNCADCNILDYDSNYVAETITSKSDERPLADKGSSQAYGSLVDCYNRLTITVKKLKESVNELEERNNELNDFVSIGAHEIKAPLMPILGIAEILELEFEETGRNEISIRKDQVESIIRNSQRLAKIASEILDVTKIESKLLVLRKKEFDLSELILKTINDYKKNAVKKNVKIIYQHHNNIIRPSLGVDLKRNNDSEMFVFADIGRIAQVISNLLDNAIRYTGSGGTVTVSTTKKVSECNLSDKEDHEQFESIMDITDSGSGIDPQLLKGNRLFSKFSSNDPSGTGLGLYISKKIVEAHDGRIWAQNNLDKQGASFTFTLPQRLSN